METNTLHELSAVSKSEFDGERNILLFIKKSQQNLSYLSLDECANFKRNCLFENCYFHSTYCGSTSYMDRLAIIQG